MDVLYGVMIALMPFIYLFVVSLAAHWISEKSYRIWFRFAIPWTIGSMVAIFLAPQYSSDFLLPIEKGSVAFVSGVLFALISLAIMVISRSKKR